MSFRLSGVVGFTLTEMFEPRRFAGDGMLGVVGLAPKPNAENDVCFRMGVFEPLPPVPLAAKIAWRYYKENKKQIISKNLVTIKEWFVQERIHLILLVAILTCKK